MTKRPRVVVQVGDFGNVFRLCTVGDKVVSPDVPSLGNKQFELSAQLIGCSQRFSYTGLLNPVYNSGEWVL